MTITTNIVRGIAKRIPAIVPLLKGTARWIVFAFADPMQFFLRHKVITYHIEGKTFDFYLRTLQGLIRSVYNGDLGGEFIDIMANLIQGQLTQAFQQAIDESGMDWTTELRQALEQMILSEYGSVDDLYRDIIDARWGGSPLAPLLARARLWANRWLDAYNYAKMLITSIFGERMMWVLGKTEQHCESCAALNGIVAFASVWEQLNVRPQNPPNGALVCEGWNCDCKLQVTTQRQSPNAFDRILNATTRI